jgi:hypothetical protein
MRVCDPTLNPILECSTCNYIPGIPEAISIAIYTTVASAAISVGTSLVSSSMQADAYNQQAAYQRQQAEYAQQIANYNAETQRQNAEVSYQLALYQSSVNQSTSELAAQIATQNAAMAEVQALGAQKAYEQGIANAEQQKIEGEAARRQGEEEARRQREENDKELGLIRAQYAASGVTPEGSPLEILGEAARYGEVAVQDIAYATELESRKQYKEAEIEEFNAQYYLIDKMGYEVEQSNFLLQAQQYEYEADLYAYDSAIAGASYQIDLNEARMTELAGGVEAWGFNTQAAMSESQANASLVSGYMGAASGISSGITSAATLYGKYSPTTKTPTATTYGTGFGAYGTNSSDYNRWLS